MNTEPKYTFSSKSLSQSLELGQKLADLLRPPILIELVGDLGGGKTALVKAIANGLGINKTVTSPTFNIHRSYEAPSGNKLEHFDLYRISDDEIVLNELLDSIRDPKSVVCTEWATHFTKLSDADKLTIECLYISEGERNYIFTAKGDKALEIIKGLRK